MVEIEQGPRETVGLVASEGGKLDAGDVYFKAAVFGVRVFADAVGDVDEGAFCEAQFGSAGGEVPTNGAHGGAGAGEDRFLSRIERVGLRQLKADVAFLHDARAGEEASFAGDEYGFRVAVAEGLELAQPAGEDWGDAIEGQFGVNAEQVLGLTSG